MPSRELLVLRHAKSSWDSGAKSDFDRPLTRRGERDAPRVALWIAQQKLVPDLVVSSPAARARETTRAVLEALDIDPDGERVLWDKRLYLAGVEEILDVLADCADRPPRVMLVGHNPGLEELVEFLSGSPIPLPKRGKTFPTAALACFEMPPEWSRLRHRAGRLVELVRPRALD
jgi:phosphohistidine phosphatase